MLDYFYYTALTVAALYEDGSADEQTRWRELLAAHGQQLREWTENYPPTFADKHALVSAEIARIEGRDLDAMRLYEVAIEAACENGFVQNEGLAHEVAARFYAVRGFDKIARVHLQDARYGYVRWGATGKVRQLDQVYPRLREAEPVSAPTGTIGAPVEHLDLATVLNVSQAVSSEIVLERLLDTLMQTAIEQAGAQRGLLLTPRGTEQRIAVLKLLASQAAISLENTRLYRDVVEREAKIRRLVDANIIGIYLGEIEGRIIEANDTFLRMVGCDRVDLVAGRLRWTELTPPEWWDRTARAVVELQRTGTIQPFEKEYLRRDGSRVPVLICSAAFDEQRDQGVAFVLDLTERKRAEAEARESEQKYRKMQTELAHVNRVT
ncbi:MAG TPA: PAS domain S-box protein, partial [Acetobacteraceae bacterium]|nr:PAS domain S-box protein [Acetobacteraceae bacterium]